MNEQVLDYVYPRLLPELVLLAAACVLFLGGTFRRSRHVWGGVALLGLAAAGATLAVPYAGGVSGSATAPLFLTPVLGDGAALWFSVLSLAGVFILVLAGWDEVPDSVAAEYHACLLLIAAGLCLTAKANELITLFVGLELVSIPTYILLYLPRLDNPAREAAMKYFMLSIFSSALLLFGFSYLYGLTGTTNLPAMVGTLARAELPKAALVALVMVVAGLGFRLTVVPFHFYAPDVYQGTPTSCAAMLAFVPKVAGFAALLRLFGYIPFAAGPGGTLTGAAFSDTQLGAQVPHLLWILAVVTMTLGNVLALLQDNVKRMLAYSSVAHAGYMLMGLVVARFPPAGSASPVYVPGVEAVLFYLAAYGAMTIGAFAVLGCLGTKERPAETVDDLAGLSKSHPGLALLLLLFLLSLIGIPLTAGFVGKMLLIWGTIFVTPNQMDPLWFRVLAVIAALNAAVGAWYYVRVITVMFLRTPLKPFAKVRAWPAWAALGLCAVLTVALGVYPKPLLDSVNVALTSPPADTPAASAHAGDTAEARLNQSP